MSLKEILLNNFEEQFKRNLPNAGYYFINHPRCPLNKNEKKMYSHDWNVVNTMPAKNDLRESTKSAINNMIHDYYVDTSIFKAQYMRNISEELCWDLFKYLEKTNNHNFYTDSRGYWVYSEKDSNICEYYAGYLDSDTSDKSKRKTENKGKAEALQLYFKQQCFGDIRINAKICQKIIDNMQPLEILEHKRYIVFKDKIFDGNKLEETKLDKPLIPRHKFDFNYDKNAKLTPRAKKELMSWANDNETNMIKLIEAIGYTLVPNQFQIALWFIGYSNSGKSTFVQEILKPIHQKQISVVDILNTNRFSFQPFLFSTLNITTEPNKEEVLSEQIIKQLSASDEISVEPKRKDTVVLDPLEIPANLTMANHLNKFPIKKSTVNRVVVINFSRVFEKGTFEPFSDEDLQSIILVAFNHIIKHKKNISIANLYSKEYEQYINQLTYSIEDLIELTCSRWDKKTSDNCFILDDFIEQYQQYRKSLQLEAESPDEIRSKTTAKLKNWISRYCVISNIKKDGKIVRGFKNVEFTPFKKVPELYSHATQKPTKPTKKSINYNELNEFEQFVYNQDVPWDQDDLETILWLKAYDFAEQINYQITETEYWKLWNVLRDGPPKHLYTNAYITWQQKQFIEHEKNKK